MSFDGNKLLFWQAWRDGINENIFSIFSVISIQWSSMSLCYTLLVLKSLIVEICIKMSKLHMVLGIIHNFSRKIVMPFIYNIWNAWNWCDLKYKHKLAWISCEGALKEKGSSRRIWPILVHLDLSRILILWTQMYTSFSCHRENIVNWFCRPQDILVSALVHQVLNLFVSRKKKYHCQNRGIQEDRSWKHAG